MLNQDRVKRMTKLALYEQREGKTAIPITKYYRSDYMGLALLKNFFLVSIGYILIVLIVAGYRADYLIDNANKLDLKLLILQIIVGYLIFLIVYSVITYIYHAIKYHRAKESVKEYYIQINRLNKIYEKDNKETNKNSGGGKKS